MTRRTSWAATAFFAVVAIIIGAFAYSGGTYTVVITTEEAQARLDESLSKQTDASPTARFISMPRSSGRRAHAWSAPI